MQCFQIYWWFACRLARRPEHVSRTRLKLPLPFGDRVRMRITLLCQFGQCAFTLDSCECHLCLERRWLRRLLFVISGFLTGIM